MDLGTSYWETSLDMYRRQSGHLTERRVWELGIVGVFALVVPNHQAEEKGRHITKMTLAYRLLNISIDLLIFRLGDIEQKTTFAIG